MTTSNQKFLSIAKSVFFKLEQYDFTKKFLIYSLITRKQNWKNKDLVKTLAGSIPNLRNFYTPSLKKSKGEQIKDLFSRLDIIIPDENFIFTIDEFKTVNYKYRIADNLSIDYSKVLNSSLNELKSNCHNSNDYCLNQIKTIEGIEILIDRTIAELKSSKRQEYIQYFENIKTKKPNHLKKLCREFYFLINSYGRPDTT